MRTQIEILSRLKEAESKAIYLFSEIEKRGLVCAGKTENELNKEVFVLAENLFGITKYWHKRIVRAGANTLLPYRENPPDLKIQEDDIVFFDFGPIFEEFEADFGRTYVIGNDQEKLKLTRDLEKAWLDGQAFFNSKKSLTGSDFYAYLCELAKQYGWIFGGEIGGHLIGQFPHESLETEIKDNYIHPENKLDLFLPDTNGNFRNWILEIHFVNKKREFGGFYEQLLR